MAQIDLKFRVKQDTSTNFIVNNPVLFQGEMGMETDTGRFKVGDGITPWNSLSRLNQSKNTIVVSPKNGDFTNITSALNSITDASDVNNYVIHVYPGEYSENITMKDFVDVVGFGKTTVINGNVSFPTSITNQSILKNIIVFSTNSAALTINCAANVYLDSVYGVSIWTSNSAVQSVLDIQQGNILINSTSELVFRQLSSNANINQTCVYRISTSNIVILKSYNTVHYFSSLDNQDDLCISFNTNTNQSSEVHLKDCVYDMSVEGSASINTIPLFYNLQSNCNTYIDKATIKIHGAVGNQLIPAFVTNSPNSSELTISNTSIDWDIIPDTSVFTASSTNSADTVRLIDCVFGSYGEILPTRHTTFGSAGNLYYRISNKDLYESRNGVIEIVNKIDRILDEDDMISNESRALATQQSIKTYIDNQIVTASSNIYTGSSPPGTTSNIIWLNSNNGVMYIYDPLRSTWISITRQTITFGKDKKCDNEFLEVSGIKDPESTYLMVRDAVITSVTATISDDKNSDWHGCDLEADYVVIGSDIEFLNGDLETSMDNLIGWDINQGQKLMCYFWADHKVDDPHVTVEYAWRYDI